MSLCDGCDEAGEERRRLALHRVEWANELGNLAMLLSLAEERECGNTIERVRERLKDLRRRVGGGL